MNNRLEECRQCPVQCRLEEKADDIVQDVDLQRMSDADIKYKVSLMSQKGRRLGCPDAEINRLRRDTLFRIRPTLKIQISPSGIFEPSDILPHESYISSDPPPTKWRIRR
jgi:hypothetical protein